MFPSRPTAPIPVNITWWAGEDLNLHGFPHSLLKAARLPFRHPPLLNLLNLHLQPRKELGENVGNARTQFGQFDLKLGNQGLSFGTGRDRFELVKALAQNPHRLQRSQDQN